MALHPERQGLQAGQDQEGVEGRDRRAEVAQAEHARGDGEGEIAEGFVQHDAAIFRARLRQHRIFARFRPVEGAAVDDDAADRIAVAADEFGQRMDDDVGAMLDRPHQIGRGQRVVDDQRQAVLAGDVADLLRCRRNAARIGQALDEDGLGLVVDLALEGRDVVGVGPAHLPAVILEGMAELVDRAAVKPCRGERNCRRGA